MRWHRKGLAPQHPHSLFRIEGLASREALSRLNFFSRAFSRFPGSRQSVALTFRTGPRKMSNPSPYGFRVAQEVPTRYLRLIHNETFPSKDFGLNLVSQLPLVKWHGNC
ncbi:MAG: hypothetical protein CMN06_07655 [Roseibacillus sp.]|nr:hypothetical protein [Roseibacillus sp.]